MTVSAEETAISILRSLLDEAKGLIEAVDDDRVHSGAVDCPNCQWLNKYEDVVNGASHDGQR